MECRISRFAEHAYLTRRCRVVSLHTALTDETRRGVVQPFTAAVTVDDGIHEVFNPGRSRAESLQGARVLLRDQRLRRWPAVAVDRSG